MNLDDAASSGISNLIQLIEEIGLPPLGFYSDGYDNNYETNLSMILAGMKKYANINYFFSVSVETDYENRSINRIYLTKPLHDTELFPS